jgi:DTW domain-containing protein YfiP
MSACAKIEKECMCTSVGESREKSGVVVMMMA